LQPTKAAKWLPLLLYSRVARRGIWQTEEDWRQSNLWTCKS
jgi:hypothetical protein